MFSAWFIMKSLKKKSLSVLRFHNPFFASKLKGGTSTSTTKSPTLGIHLPSNLPSSTWPSPSREDPLAFEVVWFFLYLWFFIVCVSHIEKLLLLQTWSWGKCFCWGKLVARYFCWKCMQAGKRWSVLVKQLHAASRACLSSTVCSRNYCEARQRAASGTHADMAAKLKILYISTHQKQTWTLKIYPQTEKEKDLPKTATFQFHDCFRVYLLCVSKSVVSTVDTFYWKNADTLKANTQAIHGPAGRLQYEHVYAYISKYIYIHMSICTASDHQTWTKISGLVHFLTFPFSRFFVKAPVQLPHRLWWRF